MAARRARPLFGSLPALDREVRAHRARVLDGGNLGGVHGDALVFQTKRGNPQSRRNALRAVHAAGDAAGLNGDGRQPVGCTTCGTRSSRSRSRRGVSLAEAASLARHANARVPAQVYAGLTEDGREAATAKLTAAGFGR